MVTRDALDRLADIVDRVETEGATVEEVSISRRDVEELAVDLFLRFPAAEADDAESGRAASPNDAESGRAASPRESPPDADSPEEPPSSARSPGTPPSPDSPGAPQSDADPPRAPPSVGVPGLPARGDDGGAASVATASPPVSLPGAGSRSDAIDETADDDETRDDPALARRESDGERTERDARSTPPERSDSNGDAGPGGGAVECRVSGCGETFDTEHGMKIHAAKVHDERPSHRDPERLREAYEIHDTFEAMTDALDADVTSQTVRRNMIAAGIHDPGGGGDDRIGSGGDEETSRGEETGRDEETGGGGNEETGDGDGETDAATGVADGDGTEEADDPVGGDAGDQGGAARESPRPEGAAVPPELGELTPPGVDPAELLEAVLGADTLYDVQQALDVEREEAQELLSELGLLELVHGRVATRAAREERKADVRERIRERADD